MTNVINVDFTRRRRDFNLSEALASFRLSTLQAERLAEELEALEREIDAMLRDNPKVSK